MMRYMACGLAAGLILASAGSLWAQQDSGAHTAGGSYVPSTHSRGCSGVLCDGNDPERAVGAPPPPPCQGLLCSVSPYSMQRPVTAGEVDRMRADQARAVAAAPAPELPAKTARKHRSKAKAAKTKVAKDRTIATRSPDPSPTR